MYIRKPTRLFKKSLRKIKSSGDKRVLEEIEDVIEKLSIGEKLEEKFKDHRLSGASQEYRECHIKPDLLLVYQINDKILLLVNIGSHSQLFG